MSPSGGKHALRQCLLTCPFVLFAAAICDGSNTSIPAVAALCRNPLHQHRVLVATPRPDRSCRPA